jgi:cytochrome c biogenesis protein CcmG/thiol:disulfide interchange protein DsbE
VLATTGCSLQHPLTTQGQALATVGRPAPDFTGTDLDGRPVRLADFRGHPLLLNFWASWCGPCRAEQPGLNDIAATDGPRGLRVLGVDVRDNLEQARIYRDEFKVPYQSLFDQAARLAYAYQVDAPPSSVLIDAGGVVRFEIAGGLGEESMKQLIKEHLGIG